ncbi:hypothetical protein, conserved [Trypanosoma brucei gambiense DAL972]|uniref:EamA domain-containing protein n=1 Tax=Trypanosoma brucei gambiense (strain MHOM/CI/86/DAL972) TaxID=679716 RepID=D0A775_TRYB9|nr:hypothetical protein, conserved [Trypanosoma brucei gambiense DAL972]CBH17526.1 hypothetical protein, conserved [Trypanosoma brucei gambiense DAL972]|eukprot:XP_011779790.1 hypothetical protein, conserved [Trypanosoma brucei gambiense DAL972]
MMDRNENSGCKALWSNTRLEWCYWCHLIRSFKCSFALFFAVLCVLAIIVGNTILLLSVNFWLDLMVKESTEGFTPIAVQVIVCLFLVLCFGVLIIVYIAVYGIKPLVRALCDTNRVGSPLYRMLLIFSSGATNGLSSALAIYAMTYTPEFMQAVLLSVIPFFAQIWTYALVREERDRCYSSMTLIGSLVLCIAGVLLASLSSFFTTDMSTKKAPWGWAFVYFLSCIVFGLWCVVQRLYFDAIMIKGTKPQEGERELHQPLSHQHPEITNSGRYEGRDGQRLPAEAAAAGVDGVTQSNEIEEVASSENAENPMLNREWAKQDENDLAAKALVLFLGIIFQAMVSFAFVPIDAIPGFGNSKDMKESWKNFSATFDFVFASWFNLRFGLLYTLGFLMSFIGCAYLNERSPPLASVVLQLAGPITSLVLIIIPEWDVFGEHGILSHKASGVIFLIIAGWAYHVWEVAYPNAYKSSTTTAAVMRGTGNV